MKPLFIDFTGIYKVMDILQYGDVLDLSFLSGTKMYIDEASEERIKELVVPCLDHRIRFLDNGNYHYMSRILASFIEEDFDLITFDNHTDDKEPAFEGLKSCGSWRLDIRDENPRLVTSCLIQRTADCKTVYEPSQRPLYISIDKDVLSEEVIKTNWDQGDMKEEELFDILEDLFDNRRILACDICGEDLVNMPYKDNRDFDLRLLGRLSQLFDRT